MFSKYARGEGTCLLGAGAEERTNFPTAPKSSVFVAACALAVVSGLTSVTEGASAAVMRPRPASPLRKP